MAKVLPFPTDEDRQLIHDLVMSRSKLGGISKLEFSIAVGNFLRSFGISQLVVKNYLVRDMGDVETIKVTHPWIFVIPRAKSEDGRCPICGGPPVKKDGWLYGYRTITVACQQCEAVYSWPVAEEHGL